MDSDITITPIGEVKGKPAIAVDSPYSAEFVEGARALGGSFSRASKRWVFDARDEPRVRELLIQVYGSDGSPVAETVTIHVNVSACVAQGWEVQRVVIAGRTVAERQGRDFPVRLHGAVVIAGGFPSGGGSVKNPRLSPNDGTVLEVRDVPAGHKDLDLSYVTVVGSEVDRDALEVERAQLTARLAEIDKLLSTEA